jgi:serine/threonine-protein kinase
MTAPDPVIGRRLAGRYRVNALLARGGMARVYRARDERLERDVAIKVLSPPYADDPDFTTRFLAEARAAAALTHPSLVHVYDSGSDEGAHFIVMELLDRHRSLRLEIDERGRLPADEAVRIGQELLGGLAAIHQHGLVHCDVKAANVMVGPGPAKLIDFGIATAPHEGARGGTSIGSLPYMSPEQLHGRAMSAASDLYSLGAVLYEALTGRAPYAGTTPAAMSAAQSAGAIPPPSTLAPGLPPALDAAILQALRSDPEARYRSAAAMSAALAGALESVEPSRDEETQVISATSAARASTRAPQRRRAQAGGRRGPWSAIGLLLVLGAAAVVIVLAVLPLLNFARETPSTPAPSVAPGGETVVIPSLIGFSTAEAIDAAREAGLDWTLHCNEDPELPAGIIDQEPAAGTEVARGSPFNLFSARFADCS